MMRTVIQRILRLVMLLLVVCAAFMLGWFKGGLDNTKAEVVCSFVTHKSLYRTVNKTNDLQSVQSGVEAALMQDVWRWHMLNNFWPAKSLFPPDPFDEPHFKKQLAMAIKALKDAKVVAFAADAEGHMVLTPDGRIATRTNKFSELLKSTAGKTW